MLSSENLFNEHEDNGRRIAPRRSKSAGQTPGTPGKKRLASGNSKPCPLSRLKSSPIKDVIKQGIKPAKDPISLIDPSKAEDKFGKKCPARVPLRRAGLDNVSKLSFTKGLMSLASRAKKGDDDSGRLAVDSVMIDVEKSHCC